MQGGRTGTCCSASSSRSQGHRVEEKRSPPAGAYCLPVFHCPTAVAVFGIVEQFARNGSAKISCMAGNLAEESRSRTYQGPHGGPSRF